MNDTGYGELADYFQPIVIFDEESGDILFICQKVFEYDIDEYYFIGVDGNNLRYGDEENGILAAGTMSKAGVATIEPIPYKDTQGNDVAASALTMLDYQTEDNTDYAAGWYGLNDVEDLSIPANISKAGTSAVPSSVNTNNQVPAIFKKSFVRFHK